MIARPRLPGFLALAATLAPPPAAVAAMPDPARFSRAVDVVRDFGAKGDGVTDDWEAIQRAGGLEASGRCAEHPPALVVLPPTEVNVYRLSQAIRLCSNVTFWVQAPSTEIRFTGDASGRDYTGAEFTQRWPTYGAILGGNIAADLETPTLAIVGKLNLGDASVTLSRADDTAQLRVGDMVDVETTSTYSPAGVEPTRLRMALVAALPGQGQVRLDRPMDFASPSVRLRRLTNLAGTPGWPTMRSGSDETHIPIFAVHHCGIIGGRWVAGSREPNFQPFNGGGGMLDCTVAPDEVIAGYGVGYGNLMQDSAFSVRREQIQTTPFEMAYQSSGTTTTIGVMEVTNGIRTRPGSGWDIAFDEGSHDNKITVERIEDYNGDLVGEWKLVGTPKPEGGETLPASVNAPTLNAGKPITSTYTTGRGETRVTIAIGIAGALNRNFEFSQAGFVATPNPPGSEGSVIVINKSDTAEFLIEGGEVGKLVSYSPTHSVVFIADAYANTVLVETVRGRQISGFVVEIVSGAPSAYRPVTERNIVQVTSSWLPWQGGFALIGGQLAIGNEVRNGIYSGKSMHQPLSLRWDVGRDNVLKDIVSIAK